MPRRWCAIVLGAALLLAAGIAAVDEVVEFVPPSSLLPQPGEYGALLFGKTVVHRIGPGPSPVPVTVSSPLTSLVGFARGVAPTITLRTAGQDTSISLPPAVKMPLKVWVLCTDRDCQGGLDGEFREELGDFLTLSNEMFFEERAGIVLDAGPDWISDQTGNEEKVVEFGNFEAEGSGDDCNHLEGPDGLTNGMKLPGAFNIYVVGRVDGEEAAGTSCLLKDVAIVGVATYWHAKLHEIGHNLGLVHIDRRTIPKQWEATGNLMHKCSDDRRFLSEGQVFWMHFDHRSAAAEIFSSLMPSDWRPRNCYSDACPPLGTWLWDDKD